MKLLHRGCVCIFFCAIALIFLFHIVRPVRGQVFDEFVDPTKDTPELSTEAQEAEGMLIVPPPTPTPRPEIKERTIDSP